MRLLGRAKKLFIVAAIFGVGIFGSLLTLNSFAETTIFKIENAELSELSATAEGSIWGFDDSSISSDITFHKLNDFAKFVITFKNTDVNEHVIRTISDSNSNSYITYSYNKHTDETINANEELALEITAKYENPISDINQKNQLSNVKFKIYIDSEEEPEEVALVPETGDNSGKNAAKVPDTSGNTGAVEGNASKDDLLTFSVISVGIIVFVIIFVKSREKSTKILTVLAAIASITTIAAAAYAIKQESSDLTLNTRFVIDDRYLVTWYDADGTEYTSVVMYGEKLGTPNVSKEGYKLVGWEDENGNPFDISEGLTGNIKIKPVFEAIEYEVKIDTDGDGNADIERTVTYEDEISLPENNNTKPGHQPNGWIDSNGNHYGDGEDISGLITEDGGTVTIRPDFTPNHYTVKLDTNGDGNADTSLEVTYGEELNLPNNNNSSTGHHPNGWTDGNGTHYDDGDDISNLLVDDGSEITLTPVLAPNVFTVGLDTDGDGDEDQTLTVTYGVEALLPETPDPEMGSKKNGWIDELGNVFAEGDDISDLLLENGEKMSLKPNYVPIEYTIAIDTDGDGDADINETVSYGESFTLPTNVSTQPGYNPNGWLNGRTHYDDGDSVQNLTVTDGATVNIVPDYTPRTIRVCYTSVQDPTTVGEDKCETATFDRMYYMSDNYFTRTGYDPIDGWAYSDTGNIEFSAGEEYNPNTDILACSDDANCKKTLYAMWDPHQTTISYAPGDGITDATGTVADSTFTFGSEATFTNNTFSRPGYTQSGWKLNGTDYELGGAISKWAVDEPSQTAKATWTPEVYNISFNMNCRPNITGTGSMDNMTNITYDAGATLTSNSFSCGEGYSFAGWKRDNAGSLITDGGRADKFDVDANGDTVQLYAQWNIDDHFIAGMREAGKTKMTANDGKDYYKMQDMTSNLCSFVPTATTNDNNEEIQLVDTRDGKVYWVSKLKDGNCWMTQNLDLDLNTTKTLTPNDTNITANWTPTRNTLPANQTSSWIANGTVDSSIDLGEYYYQEGSGKPVEYNYTASGPNANFTTVPSATNGTHTHLGNLYNSNAFFAMNSALPAGSGTIETSICPRGWGLPSDYETLMKSYDIISSGGDTINEKGVMAKPLYFARTGAVATDTNTSATYYLEPGISLSYAKNRYITTGFGAGGIKQVYVFKVLDSASISSGNINNTVKHTYITGVGTGVSVRCIVK